MLNLIVIIKSICMEWLKQQADNIATFSGSCAGFVVGATSEPSEEARFVEEFFKMEHLSACIWTMITMIVGGVLTYFAKKLCDILVSKLKKPKIK